MNQSSKVQGTDQKPQPSPALQATDAVHRRDWAAAARHFTHATTALPPDPQGSTTAAELTLRRQAHVAGSMHRRMQYFGLERAFVIPEGAR
ncbi:hypothetical protein [Polaromonas sp. JS666]|uniref:hypothetical protein n=1 Tax=Polaromonas sp. (strain JS666 / ATCC BAA-500) TaxID=296591 RepID=UPI0008848A86|nr:hypothetical protein [Polaromonas sp. JS666]SDN51365.1 hypothetical protein SAMN05720382_105300 [Polaromonas sp. JS666]